MVMRWVKKNVIGDLEVERGKAECRAGRHEGDGNFCTRCGQPIVVPVTDAEAPAPAKVKIRALGTRDFALPIVGESHYQDALRRAKAGAKDYAGAGYIKIILAREPDNRFDPNAVKVMTDDLATIGYLSRDNAVKYGPSIERWKSQGYLVRCEAKLSGGTKGKKTIGAWLDLAEPEEIAGTFDARRNPSEG